MQPVSRRIFLKSGSAVAAIPAGVAAQPTPGATPAPANSPGQPQPYLFFSAAEAAWMEAAVDRLIPPDETGPGATEAGVVTYIDRQLAGAWGGPSHLRAVAGVTPCDAAASLALRP